MKTLLIISNHGNHTGFNVKWQLIGAFPSIKEGRQALIKGSLELSDDHVIRNNRAYDTNNSRYICTSKDNSFEYDGYRYKLITRNDLDDFNGGSLGYLSTNILKEFMTIRYINGDERAYLTGEERDLGHGIQYEVIYTDGSKGWHNKEDLLKH